MIVIPGEPPPVPSFSRRTFPARHDAPRRTTYVAAGFSEPPEVPAAAIFSSIAAQRVS